jgi:dolichol-phosphate mannosyltransferase
MDGLRSPPDGASWRLSLVIPAYNEEVGICQAVAEADAALSGLVSDYEILVVDDGSSDATADAVVEASQANPHVRLLRHVENRGYGAALRTGFEAARFDCVGFTDADCQFDLHDLALLLSLTDQAPIVAGYRLQRQDPWRRRFASWGYNVLARTLLGTRVRDCDCALKIFRKEALTRLLPESQGFFVNTEMLVRARQLGLRVEQVGVRHRPRLRGMSKVRLSEVPRTLGTLLPFWWSRVLFGGGSHQSRAEPASRPWVLDLGFWTVVLLAAALFFGNLRCPLLEPQEARYAEIPRQMLVEGRFTVPVLHGQPYYDKPPLLYWLVMAGYAVCGIHDWAARLVPCGAAFLTVLVTYLWGRRTIGSRAAFAGAVVLCLSARFVYFGRMLTMDSLLCLWVIAALGAGHLALRGPRLRWGWWLGSAGACGLGLLTKGPVALALVAVPVLAYQCLDPRVARPLWRAWLMYLAAAVGVACPWYLAAAMADSTFVDYFVWRHNVLRYVAPFDHEEPFWFYLPGLLLGMLPWTLLLPALLKFLGRRSAAAAACRPAALGFFLLAFVWCLAFYSWAGCKRAGYILPAMPLLALALGCYLDTALPRRRAGRVLTLHALNRLAHGATLLVLVVGIGGSLLAVAVGLQRPASGATVASLAAVSFALVLRYGGGRSPAVSWGLCGAATFALLLAASQEVLPGYTRKFSLRGQVRPQAKRSADPRVPVICYPHRWDSVSFYLGRNDVRTYAPERRAQLIADLRAQPETILFIKSDRSLEELLHDLPASLEFVQLEKSEIVTAGIVRPRPEVPASLMAQRENAK